ncbi:MAG: serine/threonine-protein phosphatase [Lachnospiraceae bacterium]|nr:serine/threonine-protein phosphatase [Lachnospiraceae bacterium]
MTPKNSINKWITRCFLIILVLSAITSGISNLIMAHFVAMEESMESAQSCSMILKDYLGQFYSDVLISRNESFQSLRNGMCSICRDFSLEYVAVYSLDTKEKIRRYVISVADDKNLDDIMRKEFSQNEIPYDRLTVGEEAFIMGTDDIQRDIIISEYGKGITLISPYRNSDGDLVAIIDMCYSAKKENQRMIAIFLANILPFTVSLIVGMLVLLFLVRRRIIIPIRNISYSIQKFARDSSKKPERVNTPYEDEIRDIATSYEKMTEDISAYINNIEVLTRDKLENDVQMNVARSIQNGMVPEQSSLIGDDFRIGALTCPAKAVGGDFYDCFIRNENNVCIVMGDVSGKGISAAIFMAMAKTMIREKLIAGISPAAALIQANEELCAQNPEGLFATVFVAEMNTKTGALCYANAGHNPPIILKENFQYLKPGSGMALGLFEDADILDEYITLQPSEGIILYTDGVTEAVNLHREFFGTERFLETVKGMKLDSNEPEQILIRGIRDAVKQFCESCEPFDDMAVLVLMRNCRFT